MATDGFLAQKIRETELNFKKQFIRRKVRQMVDQQELLLKNVGMQWLTQYKIKLIEEFTNNEIFKTMVNLRRTQ